MPLIRTYMYDSGKMPLRGLMYEIAFERAVDVCKRQCL